MYRVVCFILSLTPFPLNVCNYLISPNLGLALWGGPEFEKLCRFFHPGVRLIDFSPDERHVVTWSPQPMEKNHTIAVWDIKTGSRLRTFASPAIARAWPIFKWSPDGQFVARISKGHIFVYVGETMELLEKRKINIPNVQVRFVA